MAMEGLLVVQLDEAAIDFVNGDVVRFFEIEPPEAEVGEEVFKSLEKKVGDYELRKRIGKVV